MVFRTTLITLLLSAFLSGNLARAENAEERSTYGARIGYLFDVSDERTRRDIEMVMLEPPKLPTSMQAPTVLVNEKLSLEFQKQYQYRFGQTTAEQVINSPSRDDEHTYYNSQNVTFEQYRSYQSQFGQYMGRRLVEYHFDNWAKSDPSVRPLYEMKDRLSNVDVKLGGKYKVKWKYSFAGPYMEASLDNPYEIEAKVQAQMNGVISAPAEMIYSAGYPVTSRVKVTGQYRQHDGVYQLVVARQVSTHLTTSVTGSIDTRAEGPAIQQNLFLVGLGWSD